ncbi:membrane protein implicated in regulation of membrane protease activity [Kitasatospora sp. MAP12-15]|uniref:cytochrome c oxidase subunit 4 n=1 Tax=unclassified Kitasatospora TaxID=2633591 RepID=UPI0024763AF6|nr:cytochrome c oxidase subunit 4 [Kitasatospora sp. MAP12-44]MDH6110257.1 membrane protein implicated in regulation of membrane protease activity [Kitasatospora sp. MAP12-44]
MKLEGWLFAGMALFLGVVALVYWLLSNEPTGTTVLTVGFLMSSLVGFFYYVQYRRGGARPQDRADGEIVDTAGPLGFFPPRSSWPAALAVGLTVLALGVVFGVWLALIGFALVGGAVVGFVFQYVGREGR